MSRMGQGIIGADAEQLEALGNLLQEKADQIRRLTAAVNGRLPYAPWTGRRATVFREQSWPDYQAQLRVIADRLEGLGQSAINNATEQRRTSDARGFTGSGLVGGGGGGVMPESAFRLRDWGLPSWLTPGLVGVGVGLLAGDKVSLASGDIAAFRGSRVGREGKSNLGRLGLSGSVGGYAGAQGNASASVGMGARGLDADAAAGVSVGVGAVALGAAALGPVSGRGTASVFAGAKIDADASLSAGLDGVRANLGGDAFAGAEAKADASVSAGGAGATAGASAYAGIGVQGDLDAEFSFERIELGGKIGVALGLGAGVNAKVSVSPSEVVKNVSKLFKF